MFMVHLERAVLRNIKQKDKKEIAEKLKDALGDESKSQKLAAELNIRGDSKATGTIERFIFYIWNYKAFPRNSLEEDQDHKWR